MVTGAAVAWPLAAVAGVLVAAAIVELADGALAAPTRRGRRRPFAQRALATLTRGARRTAPAGLGARVDAAGLDVGAGEVMAVKVAGVPAGLLLALSLGELAPGRLGLVALVAAPAAGFLAPDLCLRRCARHRAQLIEREQADVLDLLRVAVAAGMTPWRALGEIGRRHPGVLAAELGAAARRVGLGVPAAQALGRLERRCPAQGMHALIAALRRAERLGAPPARTLAALAEEARARQARRAAERAARAAPKVQLVVALLLVPSVLLLVAAALVPALTPS